MKYKCRENMSAKEGEQKINLQNFKIQKLTVVTVTSISLVVDC